MRRVGVGPTREEQVDHFFLSLRTRQIQRGMPKRVLNLEVGFVLEQELDHFLVPSGEGNNNCHISFAVLGVRVGLEREKQSRDIPPSAVDSQEQWSFATCVSVVRIGAGLQ